MNSIIKPLIMKSFTVFTKYLAAEETQTLHIGGMKTIT